MVPTRLVQTEKDVSDHLQEVRKQRREVASGEMGDYEESVADLMSQVDKIQGLTFAYISALDKLGQAADSLDVHLESTVTNRTRILIGRLRIALKDRNSLQRRIASPAMGEEAILLWAADVRVHANVTSLRHLIDLMKKMDLDTTAHEAFLIESTGELTTSDLASGALVRYLNNSLHRATAYLQANGWNILFKVLVVLLLLIVFHFLGRLAAKVVIASIDAWTANKSINRKTWSKARS